MNTLTNKKMSGLVLVEITIILPFLLFLMYASVEFGRYLYTYNTLTKMVRDSARYLSTNSFENDIATVVIDTAKETQVKNFFIYGNDLGTGTARLINLAPSQITITNKDPYITVEVDYPFTNVFGTALSDLSFGNTTLLSGNMHTELTMRAIN